jgi:membrane protease subunit (stomatin/prohibitin family)
VVNYMADGTKGAVRDMAAAVGEGLRGSQSEGRIRCHNCNTDNDTTAKFCKSCGAPLNKSCPSCGEVNDVDARFCDGCGKVIA